MYKKQKVLAAAESKLAVRLFYPFILLLYPLRHICFGVEWWDTGYNYANFVFMEYMDPMWVFSTYLGNALGNLFSHFPGGNIMLGMNFYTGLMVSILALFGYLFFVWQNKIPPWIIFLGEFLAINLCWCPTALLYNYLTYFFMAAGVAALYYGILKDKKLYFIAAGCFLGVNVFVRFPNLAEIGFIVAVWAMGIIQKKKVTKVIIQTLWCMLGYGIGIGICLGYLSWRYGLKEYIGGITRLLAMPSSASDYSLYSMIYGQVSNYLENIKWLGLLCLLMLIGVLLFQIAWGKLLWAKRFISIVLIWFGFGFLIKKKVYLLDYTSTRSVFHWAVFFLVAVFIIGIITIFRKKAKAEEKLQAGLGILILLITPLGSNNALYSAINNLFLVAPFSLWMLFRFLKQLPQKEIQIEIKRKVKRKATLHFSVFPIKTLLVSMLFMLGVQSLLFGYTYIFTESKGGENLHTKIQNNDILKGMYTDPEHAQALESISVYATENHFKGQEVILYGYIPAMSYYLQMPSAFNSWSDLRSYHISAMEDAMKALAEKIEAGEKRLPVMLLEIKYGTFLQDRLGIIGKKTEREENIKTETEEAKRKEIEKEKTEAEETERKEIEKEELERKEAEIKEDKKFALLCQWAEQYHYKVTFQNEKFVVLEANF